MYTSDRYVNTVKKEDEMEKSTIVALSGINQYRSQFTVLMTADIVAITDPYALMVYTYLCADIIKSDDMTMEDMATACHQTFTRFKQSLNVLLKDRFITKQEKKIVGRSHLKTIITLNNLNSSDAVSPLQQITMLDDKKSDTIPSSPVAIEIDEKKKTGKQTGKRKEKLVPLPEWGSQPQIKVIDFWNELQGITYNSDNLILKALYPRESSRAIQIASMCTKADLQKVWDDIHNSNPKRRDRVDIFFLWRCLSKPVGDVLDERTNIQSKQPTSSYADFFNR